MKWWLRSGCDQIYKKNARVSELYFVLDVVQYSIIFDRSFSWSDFPARWPITFYLDNTVISFWMELPLVNSGKQDNW